METKRNYTLPIIMMILLLGMIGFVTNLAAPMGVVWKAQLDAGNFLGILGNAANFIAYAVMGFPAGILLQRYGYKKTALIAVAVGFIGVCIQMLSGYTGESAAFGVYLLGAFVAGFCMCMLNTVVNPMLNTLGGGGNKGNRLIQIGGSFNSLLATFTPAVVGVLIGQAASPHIKDVFPVIYTMMGVFALVFIVLLAVSIPEPHAERATDSLGTLVSGALKFRHFIFGAIGVFVYVGVEVGTPNMLLYWLSDPAVSSVGAAAAGIVAGTYWFLMLIGRLVGASIGGKVSSKKMLTTCASVAVILILIAIFSPTSTQISVPAFEASSLSFILTPVPINAIFLILVGLCTSVMWGCVFNLAVEGLGKYVAVASGLFMVMVCGGGIIPAIQAFVADQASYLTSYWVMVIGFGYLLFYALIGSKNVNKDVSVD